MTEQTTKTLEQIKGLIEEIQTEETSTAEESAKEQNAPEENNGLQIGRWLQKEFNGKKTLDVTCSVCGNDGNKQYSVCPVCNALMSNHI